MIFIDKIKIGKIYGTYINFQKFSELVTSLFYVVGKVYMCNCYWRETLLFPEEIQTEK